MGNNTDALNIIKRFCSSWFVTRNLNQACSFISDDVIFSGVGKDNIIIGLPCVKEYIFDSLKNVSEPLMIDFSDVHEQNTDGFNKLITLKQTIVSPKRTVCSRAVYLLTKYSDSFLIRHISFLGQSKNTSKGFLPDSITKNIVEECQKLFNSIVPGGIMGGYIETGLPLHFISSRMLKYLGYDSKAELVSHINGCIINLIHPSDQHRFEQGILSAAKSNSECCIEHRIQKKDSSYIRVQTIARPTINENKESMFVYICIDVDSKYFNQQEVISLHNDILSTVFRCKIDKNNSIINANDAFFNFIGYTREEFAEMGNKAGYIIHHDDLEEITHKIKSNLNKENTIIQQELRLTCKDGSVRWIFAKAEFINDERDGGSFYCIFIDITSQMESHLKIKEQYERELLYSSELSAPNLLSKCRLNVTKNIVEAYASNDNTAITHIGDTYNSAIKSLSLCAVEMQPRTKLSSAFKRDLILSEYPAFASDYNIEFRRRCIDGNIIWCRLCAHSHKNPQNDDIMLFIYTFDITEQRIAETLLSKTADMAYDFICDIDIINNTYYILSQSKTVYEAIPKSGVYNKIVEHIISNFVDEDDRPLCREMLDTRYIKSRLSDEESYSFQFACFDHKKRVRVKQLQIYYIDEILGRICITHSDVTDIIMREKEQNEALAAALVAAKQANAAKSDFLSRMSHEIRTPMNAIIGMSAIAAKSIGNDEQVADCISKIGISSRFLLSLINDILDMSRIESGKMLLKNEKIPTEEFLNGINSICFSQADAKGVDFECIVDPAIDDYYIGDSMKLQQVLINILSNAIKFTGEGGKVTFSATQRKKTKNMAFLRFIINDTGIGMSEDFLPYIFDPFSQEEKGTTSIYSGTGLGLSIAKSIVDMMDGSITIRSIKDIGSEFTVDVKLGITEEEKQRRIRNKQNTYSFSHLKTLVVDDDIAVCESAVSTLNDMGVTAEWVDSGEKAIERTRELWTRHLYYDMILIDWKMPKMDGIETARHIRTIVGPEVTIIIITAYDWTSIEHEAKRAGVNLLMSKPVFKSSLISAFNKALGQREEEAEMLVEDFNFSGKRILLAEDHPLNAEIAVKILESKGFSVNVAENGLRALEMFGKSEPGYYDAVLMDIRMPVMDGLMASYSIRHLSNRDANSVPIIAMTANAFDDDVEKSIKSGMNAHLAKPIEPDRLYKTLYDFIYKKEND